MNVRTPLVLILGLLVSLSATNCTEEDPPPAEEPEPECGNGLLEDGETCEGEPVPEGCDPASCTVQAGYECTPMPPAEEEGETDGESEPPEWTSTCSLLPVCGNGLIEEGEACDDMDTAPGDGCDQACQIEEGFSCGGEPSDCAACGDGFVDEGEQCDGGALIGSGSPGCSDSCQVVPGWECFNEPSMCGPNCGDGMWFDTSIPGVTQGFAEECDDGNNENGDGCNAVCVIEEGCDCDGDAPGISMCECGMTDDTTDTGGTTDTGTDTGMETDTDGTTDTGGMTDTGGSTDTGGTTGTGSTG